MNPKPDWLPNLVRLEDFGGDVLVYIDALYQHFLDDFVHDRPFYQGRRVGMKRHPELNGKAATFVHITSSGNVEEDREYEACRSERIRWPRAIIQNCDKPEVQVWENRRGREKRVLLWFAEEYLVVLADRGNYVLLWTAYCTDREHTRRKLRREYQIWLRASSS
jgi:hypothetical protein